jgi:hypothetical protein
MEAGNGANSLTASQIRKNGSFYLGLNNLHGPKSLPGLESPKIKNRLVLPYAAARPAVKILVFNYIWSNLK